MLGGDVIALPTYAQTHQLPYVSQILEETLRLWPTAPAFTRRPYKDAVLGGKYKIEGRTRGVVVLTGMLNRDQKIWGDNTETFDPDRFSPENRAKIPPNAYKAPFGTGAARLHRTPVRAARGDARLGHAAAALRVCRLRQLSARDQTDVDDQAGEFHPSSEAAREARFDGAVRSAPAGDLLQSPRLPRARPHPPPPRPRIRMRPWTRMRRRCWCCSALHFGTAEGIAHRVADDARSRGFAATVGALDDHADALPKQAAPSSSSPPRYNGQPPDNAAKFCQKLRDPTCFFRRLRRRRVQRLRLWQSRLVSDLSGDPDLHRRRARETRREGASTSAAKALRAATSTGTTARGTASCFPRSPTRSTCRRQRRRRKQPVCRWPGRLPRELATSPQAALQRRRHDDAHEPRNCSGIDCEPPSERSTRHIEIVLPSRGVSYNAGDHLGIVLRNGP